MREGTHRVMDTNEQPLLTPDLPPVVDVPDLTFPSGRRTEKSPGPAERNGEKESPAPSSTPQQRPLAA
ncbi:hypothetical protein EEJ42_06505 [Streptomyces botrytidirepellens]|uniref:Uncharacterized protein n=2 Tax=Streptomyces TaxID=1883 RepID=A0A3M8WWF6_9ACTN|nr:hypothetical protein EEJ42_06505 [Streptomyces botrytidirepellens]